MSRSVETAVQQLRGVLAELEPARLDGDRARELVEQFAEAERLCAAGKSLALRQVAATGSWRKAGPFRDLHAWLAAVTKTTLGQASVTAETAHRLEALPDTEAAARAGDLSSTQLDTIADAATADPQSERELLDTAGRDGVRRLREEAGRVKAAACHDEVAREGKIRKERSLRHWTDLDGVGRIDVRGPVVDVAQIMAALQPFERTIFDDARNAELRERADAYAFDALVAMTEASQSGTHGGKRDGMHAGGAQNGSAPRSVGVIRIDHDALLRRHTAPGEVCELAGVGPIPVHEASRMLDDAFLKAVVVKGKRITMVSHVGRLIPAHLRTAIEERDQECVIEGCYEKRHLEIDHNTPIEHGGRTELSNLNRLCTFHHRHKHKHNYRLGGDGGHMTFVTISGLPPPDP